MNLDHFSMPSCLTTDFFVSRILLVASSVSRNDKANTCQSHKNSFHTPEAASSESSQRLSTLLKFFAFSSCDIVQRFSFSFLLIS